ncbi:MAG: NAD-dependent DNA ligase LigA [Sphaerochaetaceae bacterium]|nr:NAD-dependent DNA ligase LigA [Sphaerochaetaceae bacterium]
MEKVVSEIKSLTEKLNYYQKAYYVDSQSLVSDLEYDRLFDRLVQLEKEYPELKDNNSPTMRVGSDLSGDFPEFRHTIPVLSLDKAYSDEAVLNWIEKSEKKGNRELSFVIEEKIDGISMVLYYEKGNLIRAVTRGNGIVGNEVTNNIRTVSSVPLKLNEDIDIVVRGEIFLPKAGFEAINAKLDEPYANPRNLAAGTVRRLKSSETAKVPLKIFVYEGFTDAVVFEDHIQIMSYLKHLGFSIDPNIGFFCNDAETAKIKLKDAKLQGVSGSFEDISAYIKNKTSQRKSLDYEIDGLVSKINEIKIREEFGYTSHHPRWAIAYKFEAPQAETTIKAIDVQVGRTGRVTPVARVETVALGGSEISNITLHNQSYIDALEIAVGDTVAISKRGDVIPAVEVVTEKNEQGNTTWKIPENCPVCNTPLIKKGAHNFCPNFDCPSQAKGRLAFFVGKSQMNIEGFGPGTVEQLYEMGVVQNIEDLYLFDYNKLLGTKGFGRKKVDSLIKGIQESKKTPFNKVLVSLGISEIGKKAVDLLIKEGYSDIDKLLELAKSGDYEKLLKIKQIGEKTVELLFDSLKDPRMQTLIKKLKEIGLQFQIVENDEPLTEQIFDSQIWCVTGSFDTFSSREVIFDLIEKRGGKTTTSVTSKTTYLLAGKNAGSKLEKAEKLGTKVINEKEFLVMIDEEAKQEKIEDKLQPELF